MIAIISIENHATLCVEIQDLPAFLDAIDRHSTRFVARVRRQRRPNAKAVRQGLISKEGRGR